MKIYVLVLLCTIWGCVPMQLAKTEVEIPFGDGRVAKYTSTKDQTGITINIYEVDPKTELVLKHWEVEVEKSGTPEAAFMALAEQQKAMADLLRTIMPFVKKALRVGPPVF